MKTLNDLKQKIIKDNSFENSNELIQINPTQLIVHFEKPITFEGKNREMQGAIGKLFLSNDNSEELTIVAEFHGMPMYIVVLKIIDGNLVASCAKVSSSTGNIAEFNFEKIKKVELNTGMDFSTKYTLLK